MAEPVLNIANGCNGTLHADAIYFLMHPGWKNEFRSNRWHYASRWSKRLPVVLVQPDDWQVLCGRDTVNDADLANCRILYVPSAKYRTNFFENSLRQYHVLLRDIKKHAFERVILWIYDSDYLFTAAMLPAVCRVFHATENYFDYQGYPRHFFERHEAAINLADIVIAVSKGVADSYQAHRNKLPRVQTITNGCDYSFYAVSEPDLRLERCRRSNEKLAVYAGNINGRLNFECLMKAAGVYPLVRFVFYGTVKFDNRHQAARWGRLRALPNVDYFGPVSVDRLPGIYRACDLGIIPYTNDPLVVENTFPLKTLEMAATGLPVVTSLMKSILHLKSPGLVIAHNDDEFIAACGKLGRKALSDEQIRQLRRLCRMEDYDVKFEHVTALVAAVATPRRVADADLEFVPGDESSNEIPGLAERAWRRNRHWVQLSRGLKAVGLARFPRLVHRLATFASVARRHSDQIYTH